MKVAICDNGGSFTPRWLDYCAEHSIPHKRVRLFDDNIITEVRECSHIVGHLVHYDVKTAAFACGILRSLEETAVRVFPSSDTFWHFDNKVAQKYLLEAIGAPLAPSHVFFERHQAMAWLEQAKYPVVFKLKGGAGSANVRLVRDASDGIALVHKMLGKGMRPMPSYFNDARSKLRNATEAGALISKLKRLPAAWLRLQRLRQEFPRDRAYVYFQEYLPGNDYDTRVTVIGDRAFAFRRFVRPDDFRASGSGRISHDKEKIDLRCIDIAFEISRKLRFQSMAYDFALDRDGVPRVLEISYCYMPEAVRACAGYWDGRLGWHEGHIWPQDAILEDLLKDKSLQKSHISEGPAT